MRRRGITALLALALAAVMAYSFTQFWAIENEIEEEENLHQQELEMKPGHTQPGEDPLARLREQNPDIVGWITVPYTNIDYPVVQAKDNDCYLRRDLDGNYALAGTVFMDYRSPGDGSGYSILYGHNMKSDSMFGTLKRFEDRAFFDSHPGGHILLEDGWRDIEFFAFLIVPHNDAVIYGQPQSAGFAEYAARKARHSRPDIPSHADRLVALSTCAYEYEGARMVLIGKIT